MQCTFIWLTDIFTMQYSISNNFKLTHPAAINFSCVIFIGVSSEGKLWGHEQILLFIIRGHQKVSRKSMVN